ncbi:MAG: hypothetical protein HFG14_05715 [Lachnospiraceae bacterium]|jgi:hypothetical protein|nr:hypothetical protein [Lachnospiraceae bacterium]
MQDHTIRLLKECNSGCKMAVNSMQQILGYVSDGKLRRLIEEYEEKHQKLEYESFRKLTELNEAGKEPEKMASAFSWLSTEMKMMMKGDDRQAAKIMMDGCNMGIQSICGYQNQYAGASTDSMALADGLVRTEESFRDELKAFL